MKNWEVKHFEDVHVGKGEGDLLSRYLGSHDFADGTARLIVLDVRQLARWFTEANGEPFVTKRVTVRDIVDFRDHLRRTKRHAVATVNRSLVLIRRYFGWLVDQEHITSNPAQPIKELKRQQLAPKGLERQQVRKLLREVELRQDIRANAVFSLFLYTGCRIGDLVPLELSHVILNDRSGSATFRLGKGNKQRTVPLPLPARKALQAYLESRPPIQSDRVFIGERGPLSERGVRALCDKYSAICGFKIFPHLLRHTMAHQFLENNNNDLVALAQILGHENLNTTKRYVQKTQDQLGDAADRIDY